MDVDDTDKFFLTRFATEGMKNISMLFISMIPARKFMFLVARSGTKK